MSRNAVVLAAIASTLLAASLSASSIDPLGADNFPDPTLTDGLEFSVAAPICYDNAGHSECLENAYFIPTTNPADQYIYNGNEEQDTLNLQLHADLYQDGIFQDSLTMDGSAETVVERTAGQFGTFNSEMVSLDLSGVDSLLGPIQLRETPGSTPTGTTTISSPIDGQYPITSFFDVFTDISLDGGNTWLPTTTGAAEVDLAPRTPEPGSVFLLGAGVLVLAGRLPRRR